MQGRRVGTHGGNPFQEIKDFFLFAVFVPINHFWIFRNICHPFLRKRSLNNGEVLGRHNSRFVETLNAVDRLIIAGQAKSHCVAWTIADLLKDLKEVDPGLARKIYLLEDCTSPVVVPGMDYTDQSDQAFLDFEEAGMHIVKSFDDFPG